MFSFTIQHTDTSSKARMGKVVTPHGAFETPAFLPVGTNATIKALGPDDIKNTGSQIILSNTYHLYLRPGHEIIQKLGGLHNYMGWNGPMFTDSGGFQVFSLGFGIEHEVGKIIPLFGEEGGDLVAGEVIATDAKNMVVRTKLCKIEDEGPTFVSHVDGSVHFFPPEKSIDVQMALGADFIVALDECTSPLHDYDYTKYAMERTHRWEERSLSEFKKLSKHQGINVSKQFNSDTLTPSLSDTFSRALFGVIQGGPFEDLRIASTKFVADHDFFGVGIGGALVSKAKMHEILDWIHPHLPPDRPRHLFGIGTIDDIFHGVERGVDMFDCVSPSRMARMGYLLVNDKWQMTNDKLGTKRTKSLFSSEQEKAYKASQFRLDISKSCFLDDSNPLDSNCRCYACTHFSRAYICHLFRAKELLAYRLATIHNITFMQDLMRDIRTAISEDRFLQLKESWLAH